MAAGWLMVKGTKGAVCGQAATHREVPDKMYVLAKSSEISPASPSKISRPLSPDSQ